MRRSERQRWLEGAASGANAAARLVETYLLSLIGNCHWPGNSPFCVRSHERVMTAAIQGGEMTVCEELA